MREIEHRCSYVNMKNPLYIRYHDEEWGMPEHSDQKLYELLILESFQAGLSWECILNKRENFRAAFDGFNIDRVCAYDEAKCAELMNNPGIVRNRRKIAAAVNNSIIFKEIQKEFGSFDAFIWGFTNSETIVEDYHVRTTSPLSDMISKDLKKRGMKFVGSTIIYSYLQAIGVLNAHGEECDLRPSKSEAMP
ncbi:MAG: DNA-3-methyladenine glycosylase I [Clostridiales bacterium]|nr:DNA-3-methyladenine glycosylase I [Clostridiales bacterium]MCD8005220.1 DNA-3-methyladenine glycosylase I [Oscillospiraceae bacterium]